MSDLRITAVCTDCPSWLSGTSALEWTSEHLDIAPDHRVILTRSGHVERDTT